MKEVVKEGGEEVKAKPEYAGLDLRMIERYGSSIIRKGEARREGASHDAMSATPVRKWQGGKADAADSVGAE
jgi:hypothetical protein